MVVRVAPSLPLLPLLPLAAPQTPEGLLRVGDPVVGVGRVESVERVAVVGDGTWLAQVTVDGPSGTRDQAVLRVGFPALREGDPVAAPPGATVRAFHGWDVDRFGNLVWEVALGGAGIDPAARRGVYWNTRPLARQGTPVGVGELEADAVWASFGAARFGEPGQVWIAGEVQRAGGGPARDVMVRVTLDAFGRVLATEVCAATGWVLPVLDAELRDIPGRGAAIAASEMGHLVWLAKRQGPAATDGVLLVGLDRVVAVEGDPAPVEGRTYASFELGEADVNRFGEVAFTCHLDGRPDRPGQVETSYLLVARGEKLVQEGDVLPSLGAPIDGQPQTPVRLADSGDVFWSALLRDVPSDENQAYLRNHEVLLHRGRTSVEGREVVALDRGPDAFDVSRDGRFFLGRVVLEGEGEALVRIDLGSVVPLPGCFDNPGTLTRAGGAALPGARLRLALDHARRIGDVPLVVLAPGAGLGGAPEACGLATPLGEVLVAPPARLAGLGPPWTGAPVMVELAVPAALGLVDSTWTLQGFFHGGAGAWTATNGLRVRVGAP